MGDAIDRIEAAARRSLEGGDPTAIATLRSGNIAMTLALTSQRPAAMSAGARTLVSAEAGQGRCRIVVLGRFSLTAQFSFCFTRYTVYMVLELTRHCYHIGTRHRVCLSCHQPRRNSSTLSLEVPQYLGSGHQSSWLPTRMSPPEYSPSTVVTSAPPSEHSVTFSPPNAIPLLPVPLQTELAGSVRWRWRQRITMKQPALR